MRRIIRASAFEKDLERMIKRGYEPFRAHALILHLQKHSQAPAATHPHKLKGEWVGKWECHVAFDWLLIYSVDNAALTLWRTGTHEDLFG